MGVMLRYVSLFLLGLAAGLTIGTRLW